jgi:hypothetical protein
MCVERLYHWAEAVPREADVTIRTSIEQTEPLIGTAVTGERRQR